ncbi:MAG TPA: hypothetical protein VI566_08140, partial [Xanthomonadales bacterium]|nr:hypothetical protein [Xanthomonadales bacterium]
MNTAHARRLSLHLLSLVLLGVASGLQAEQGTTLIKAAAWVDVASGKVVSPALIVVAGGRITDVNPASPPADAELIELPELTVLPGMI